MLRTCVATLGWISMGWGASALSDMSWALFVDITMNWITECIVWTGDLDRPSALFWVVDKKDVVADRSRECIYTFAPIIVDRHDD